MRVPEEICLHSSARQEHVEQGGGVLQSVTLPLCPIRMMVCKDKSRFVFASIERFGQPSQLLLAQAAHRDVYLLHRIQKKPVGIRRFHHRNKLAKLARRNGGSRLCVGKGSQESLAVIMIAQNKMSAYSRLAQRLEQAGQHRVIFGQALKESAISGKNSAGRPRLKS